MYNYTKFIQAEGETMVAVVLTKWGNSIGIRLPLPIVNQIRAHVGERFSLKVNKGGSLTLTPIKDSQEGWLEAFNAAADASKNALLLDQSIENDFDKDEWKW